MPRPRLLLVAAALALTAAAPALALSHKTVKPTVLIANVGRNDGYAMTLTKNKVDMAYGKLKRGPYTIYVHDYSDIHNIRIKGPGINKWTTVAAIGSKVWKINLRKGTYTVICDPHPTNMQFTFKVI